MNDELSLVPPARLGALLTEHRTRRGLTVEEMQVHTNVGFTADELRRIEQGQLPLSDSQINRLLHAYDAGAGPIVPERTDLVIDLGTGAMFAGRRTKMLPESDDVDDILGRYLSLLYLIRGMEPGGRLPLRTPDLEVLSGALERSITEIEGRLFELMLPGQVSPWYLRLRHRLAVPAAGIMVGLTAVGTLVFVQFPKGTRPVLGAQPLGDAAGVALDTGLQAAALAAAEPAEAELAPALTVTRDVQAAADPSADVDSAADLTVIGDAEIPPALAVSRSSVTADPSSYEPGNPLSLGRAAESLIDYPFRQHLDDWRITFAGPRDGYRGNTNTVTRTITVYVADHDTPATVAGVLAHELAHALDVLYLDEAERQQWMAARSIDGAWWPDSGASDFHLGAGDFAEAVAVVIADSPSDSELGPFTADQLELVRRLLP